MSEWISVEDRLPAYGKPVLLVGNNVVQHVTYMLDGCDDVPDWFEPYHFDHDDNCKLLWNKATYWMELPEPPSGSIAEQEQRNIMEENERWRGNK
jgi:hypothetical protein